MKRVLVLACKPFDFIGNDGKPVQFARIWYISDDIQDKNIIGMVVGQMNISLSLAKKIGFSLEGSLPAICDLELDVYFDYAGNAKVRLDDALIIKALDMCQLMVI